MLATIGRPESNASSVNTDAGQATQKNRTYHMIDIRLLFDLHLVVMATKCSTSPCGASSVEVRQIMTNLFGGRTWRVRKDPTPFRKLSFWGRRTPESDSGQARMTLTGVFPF